MKIETEIKLALPDSDVLKIVYNIEKLFECQKSEPFHQTTHQFFLEDYSKQTAFPRVRNEENGNITLTVKAKIKESSDFFKRIELETTIGDIDEMMAMMPYFGFPKKISWEKRRHSFLNLNNHSTVCFYLDETPMGWFLEIEADENNIEKTIDLLGLQLYTKINKPYLGVWEDYKIKHNIISDDMLFK